MPVIDLTRYIVASAGTWTDPSQEQYPFTFTQADTVSPERLMLRWAGDFVALTGPLSIHVTVQAENMTVPLALVGNLIPTAGAVVMNQPSGTTAGTATIAASTRLDEATMGNLTGGRGLSLQASTIYEYTLQIPAGQAWPFTLSEQLASLGLRGVRQECCELGNNLGYRVIIEPAFAVAKLVPVTSGADLPCDFAVADQSNTASFFPVACEPCQGSVIGLPPAGATALVVPPAEGGCVRTRFFNGMFITREDLETEQRYLRLKSRLHNRAAGAGVVWGLAVCKQGSAVLVAPGYGVDCCGNDLALTTTYKVEIAALLADPAAAALVRQRGPARMHLLLEYVECPSDPRPVHGDPCAPQDSRCEMSRIRESVRLRLVPPRDYDALRESAPLARFLNEVQLLRGQFAQAAAPAAAMTLNAPFQLRVNFNMGQSQRSVTVRPAAAFDQHQLDPLRGAGAVQTITIDVIPDPLTIFVGGTQSGQALQGHTQLQGVVQSADPIDLAQMAGFSGSTETSFALQDQQRPPSEIVFKLSGWQAQSLFAAEDAPALSGDLTFTVRFGGREVREVVLAESEIAAKPVDLAPSPCAGEPCSPARQLGGFVPLDQRGFGIASAGSQDPVALLRAGMGLLLQADTDPTGVLPWLHPDPVDAAKPGDPKALILAALAGWLAEMMVRERVGTSGEVVTARRKLAQAIYRVAWTVLFGLSEAEHGADLGAALRRLLEAWCDELPWRGPQCHGDPHGVVIGCAVVAAGTIQSIDLWGGRRHVVHYPLLEHWGAQFGIAPLDLMASRFFSQLCCIASLPALGQGVPQAQIGQDGLIALGNGWLAIGQAGQSAGLLRERGIRIAEQRQAGIAELITAALSLVQQQRSGTPPQRYQALVASTLGASGITLLLPA